jgi:hypothetical protein
MPYPGGEPSRARDLNEIEKPTVRTNKPAFDGIPSFGLFEFVPDAFDDLISLSLVSTVEQVELRSIGVKNGLEFADGDSIDLASPSHKWKHRTKHAFFANRDNL